jgi:hypothetical protein
MTSPVVAAPTVPAPPVPAPAVAPPAVAAPPVPATTPLDAFRQCDGFGAPTKSGDGMVEQAMFKLPLLGDYYAAGRGDTRQSDVGTSAKGEAACTLALSQAEFVEQHRYRKVSLLRARAAHRIVSDRLAEASADLSAADAIFPPGEDPAFDRSMRLGTNYIRAVVLRRSGKQQEAEALIRSTIETRRLNAGSMTSALIALGPDGPPALKEQLLKEMARVQPRLMVHLYDFLLHEQRFAEAIALYPQVPAPPQKDLDKGMKYDFQIRMDDSLALGRSRMFVIQQSSKRAYAIAEVEGVPAGRKALEAVKAQLDEFSQPPPQRMRKNGAPIPLDVADRYAARVNKELGQVGSAAIATWTRRIDELEKGKGWRPGPFDAGEDIGQALGALLNSLPPPETAGQIPVYKAGPHPRFAFRGSANDLDTEGYRDSVEAVSGATLIRFRDLKASMPAVQDAALLRAAEVALDQNARGFIILENQSTSFTNVNTYMGMSVANFTNGHAVELKIKLVREGETPSELATAPWRLIDANAEKARLDQTVVRK